MSACRTYRRQIALLSVQALTESESAATLAHLDKCAACRAYAKQLEGVVELYLQDAERPVTPGSALPRVKKPLAHGRGSDWPWFKWLPRPAMAAVAAFIIICAAVLLNRLGHDTVQPLETAGTIQPPPLPAIPTIGNTRYLTAAELEQVTGIQSAPRTRGTEFVFSVRTRDEGL